MRLFAARAGITGREESMKNQYSENLISSFSFESSKCHLVLGEVRGLMVQEQKARRL